MYCIIGLLSMFVYVISKTAIEISMSSSKTGWIDRNKLISRTREVDQKTGLIDHQYRIIDQQNWMNWSAKLDELIRKFLWIDQQNWMIDQQNWMNWSEKLDDWSAKLDALISKTGCIDQQNWMNWSEKWMNWSAKLDELTRS